MDANSSTATSRLISQWYNPVHDTVEPRLSPFKTQKGYLLSLFSGIHHDFIRQPDDFYFVNDCFLNPQWLGYIIDIYTPNSVCFKCTQYKQHLFSFSGSFIYFHPGSCTSFHAGVHLCPDKAIFLAYVSMQWWSRAIYWNCFNGREKMTKLEFFFWKNFSFFFCQ